MFAMGFAQVKLFMIIYIHVKIIGSGSCQSTSNSSCTCLYNRYLYDCSGSISDQTRKDELIS